jgi:hypothetical protein
VRCPFAFCSFLCVHRQLDERMRARIQRYGQRLGCETVAHPESLQSQVVVYRDFYILLRPEIAFGCLDRRVAEQEFDLLQIPAVLSAQLGTRPAEIVGAEVLNPDLLR